MTVAAPRLRLRPAPLCLVVSAAAVGVATGWLDLQNSAADRTAAGAGLGLVTAGVGLVLVPAGAVVLSARPRHGVGLVLASAGALWVVDGMMEAWSAYALAHGLPGLDVAVWVVLRLGAFLMAALPLLLLLYPSGGLGAGRQRAAAVAVAAAALALPVALQVAPDSLLFLGTPRPDGVRTDWLALPLPADAMTAVLGVARVLTLSSYLAALAVVVLRYRRSGEEERRRLRWLLWAGVVCALAGVVFWLVPFGAVTTLALTVAVVATAVSVTVGVVRPDLADVDALVAGTLTYAGVAAVVVALDLAVLAAATSLLGERFQERQVTLLVLVLAVAVYGPLRTTLGAAVRRLLFGRRGDRYDVVSAFAARLEGTRGVDEQLPALAAAVASAFKVPFVRVEVLAPDGGVLAASSGERTAETHDLDIAYDGERIGRLVLPRRGVRSLLSRRDQGLLVDLVRQAAVAMRSSLLAAALQDSRERLVLGREDDRRRIRRDLHDGLGPALSGVAMRLDAAGNAVEADPGTARRLIRLARTEVTDALDDVRRLVHDLRPPALDDLGIAAALEQQAERLRSRLDVTVDATGLGALPAAVEVAAYRIVSEALTNVVKHAEATRCVVRLRPEGDAVVVDVTDDGRGIDEDVTAGVGLLSLRERAEELGGRCEVTCPPEGGTRVHAWLPGGGAHR